jgi:hypothetical protein
MQPSVSHPAQHNALPCIPCYCCAHRACRPSQTARQELAQWPLFQATWSQLPCWTQGATQTDMHVTQFTLKTHNCYRVKQIAKWWAYNNCTLQPAGSSKQEWAKCPACRQPFGQHPQLLLPAVAVAAAAAAAAVAAGQCHATAVPPACMRYSPESAGGTECRQALCTAGSTNVLH